MGPIGHGVLSTSIGVAVWQATDEPLAVPMAIATGVFIDGDHVLDFVDGYLRGYMEYMFVLLHAWEYLIIVLGVLLFWQHPLYMAAALGYASHVTSDHLANPTRPWAYFITYRAYRRFKRRMLVIDEPPLVPRDQVPLWGKIEPWLWRRLYKMRHKGAMTAEEPAGD